VRSFAGETLIVGNMQVAHLPIMGTLNILAWHSLPSLPSEYAGGGVVPPSIAADADRGDFASPPGPPVDGRGGSPVGHVSKSNSRLLDQR